MRQPESPSARKVWIEMYPPKSLKNCTASPSARKVWIEILLDLMRYATASVTFREEGVD